MKNEMKIFVATHKEFEILKSKVYIPIQVGANLNSNKFGYLTDDTKDNISYKNKNYCELTALYWIWKNDESDIKGLCHYRRYLSKKDVDINPKFFIDEDTIKKDLEKYDIIIPKKRFLKKITCKRNYLLGQGIERDLLNLREIIHRIYPEYEDNYIKILEGNKCSYCNVMITKKENFDAYCEWLFNILFALEEITDLSEYTPAQARIYGYLSEILLNVWIDKNKLKTKEYTLINTEVKKDKKYYIKLFTEKIKIYRIIKNIKIFI